MNLCRYIHGNLVKDGIVANITQWQYSNYLEWIGERDGKLIDKAFVQDNFDTPMNIANLFWNICNHVNCLMIFNDI